MQRISDVSHLTLERATQSRESIRGLAQWCQRLEPLAAPDLLPTDLPDVDPIYTGGSVRRKRRLAGSEQPA